MQLIIKIMLKIIEKPAFLYNKIYVYTITIFNNSEITKKKKKYENFEIIFMMNHCISN